MGNPKQKWTSREEEALRAGVKKHGTGKWKNIKSDPEFEEILSFRSNIDLKDKWRNLTVSASNGSIPRDKWKTQQLKLNSVVSAAPLPKAVNRHAPSSSATTHVPRVHDASTDLLMDDTSNCSIDVKTASKYDAMVFEALSKINDPSGADTSTIVSIIEQKHDVAPNFRKLLGSRLRRLVGQGKLEKVNNSYRMKGLKPTPPAAPKPRDTQPRQDQSPGYGDTIDEASVKAACWIADIENKSFVASEAVKEAERVSRMSEDADAFLDFSNEILEKCLRGRIVLMA